TCALPIYTVLARVPRAVRFRRDARCHCTVGHDHAQLDHLGRSDRSGPSRRTHALGCRDRVDCPALSPDCADWRRGDSGHDSANPEQLLGADGGGHHGWPVGGDDPDLVVPARALRRLVSHSPSRPRRSKAARSASRVLSFPGMKGARVTVARSDQPVCTMSRYRSWGLRPRLQLRARIVVCVLFAFVCSVTHAAQQAIASAHPLATRAGEEILDQGGNAFDAAVAVAAALAVVEPYASGLGGGGFFLLRRGSDDLRVMIDAREAAPGRAAPQMYLDESGKQKGRLSLDGALASGIPGTPAAIAWLTEKYGTLPLSRTLA